MPTSSSQTRKEEAGLRRIAKQSRLARKEEAARERRRRQKEKRQKQQLSTEATGITAREPEATSKRRLGAIIMPAEVRELQQRLLSEGSSSLSGHGESNSSSSKVKSTKKNVKRRAPATSSSQPPSLTASSSNVSSSSCVSSCPRFEEPPHSLEVHHKNRQVLVNVTLHHVPPQHVDVSETTETTLIVDTRKHTKKYRLELLMPDGIQIDPEQTSCELDCSLGVLKCILPIKNEIPASLQEERERMINSIQKQKALRFHVGADGDLKVRTRRALLAKNEEAQAVLRAEGEAMKKTGKRSAQDDSKGEVNTTSGKKQGEMKPSTKRAKNESARAASHDIVCKSSPKEGTNGAQQKQETRKKSSVGGAGDVFAKEHQRALKLAKSAGKAAQLTLRERIAQAKIHQKKLQERLSVRSFRREVRSERTQESFSRVLSEQKRQLLARARLNASIASVEKKNAASKKNARKSVTFSEV